MPGIFMMPSSTELLVSVDNDGYERNFLAKAIPVNQWTKFTLRLQGRNCKVFYNDSLVLEKVLVRILLYIHECKSLIESKRKEW
jgi:hypothetical protein